MYRYQWSDLLPHQLFFHTGLPAGHHLPAKCGNQKSGWLKVTSWGWLVVEIYHYLQGFKHHFQVAGGWPSDFWYKHMDFSAPILHSRVLLHLNINTWFYKIYVHNHIHIFFVGNRGCCEGYSASLHISRPPKHLKPGVASRSRAHRIGQQRLQNNTPWKINGWNLNLIV